jgi:glutamate synthase (NADPH/NADH) large chain
MESAEDLVLQGVITGITPEKAVKNLIKSLGKGVLKVMSKMGISTIASYTGAQVFEAIGLSQDVVDEYFVGTTSRLGGVSLDVIAQETIARHHIAYPPGGEVPGTKRLPIGGEYQWRREGEPHLLCSTQPATSAMTFSSATQVESMSRASA